MKLIKNNPEFQWIGEGVPFQRRGKKIRYEACCIGSLRVRIGEFVLVRNDDALDPEDVMTSYVGQIMDLYDTGDEIDPYQAQVQWFSRIPELPSYAIKSLTTVGHELEVVQDKRSSWNSMVDVETVFEKCEVIYLALEDDCDAALSEYADKPFPVFFCRYVFSGTSLVPVKSKDKYVISKSQNSKAIAKDLVKETNSQEHDISIKSSEKDKKMYCAIPTGTLENPKVLIKKISDKILEKEIGSVKIFVADSVDGKIDDVTNVFLDRLELKKKEQCNNHLTERPTIHNFSSQVQFLTDSAAKTNGGLLDNDFDVEPGDSNIRSETNVTPRTKRCLAFEKNLSPMEDRSPEKLFTNATRNSPRKNATPLSNKLCKQLFVGSTRNSPSKTENVTRNGLDSPKEITSPVRNKSDKQLFAYSTRNSPRRIENVKSDVDDTPTKNSPRKNAHPLGKSCKQLFTYSTRNSPRKKSGNMDVQVTPKKFRVSTKIDSPCSLKSDKEISVDSPGARHSARRIENVKSDVDDTPTKNSPRKNACPLSKSCKQLFTYSTRNSPRRKPENMDVQVTPKKFRVSTKIDSPFSLKSDKEMSVDSSGEDNDISESFSNKLKLDKGNVCEASLDKRPIIHTFTLQVNENKGVEGKDGECMNYKSETECQTPKSRRKSIRKKTATPLTKKENNKEFAANSTKSPGKTPMNHSADIYSTPTKKPKLSEVIDNFCLTRSGRRVKAVNYNEKYPLDVVMNTPQKNPVSTSVPSKKKMPNFVRKDCSEDSDSSNYSAKDDDSDDSSLSGVSLFDETSPKKKNITKKLKKTGSKRRDGDVKVSSSRKCTFNLSIPERKTPVRTPKNALEETRQRLHVSAVPDSLPCREEEYSDIYNFVKDCLYAQSGGCMYISGVSGTGKTATVHEVVRNLEEEKESGEVPIFKFVEVNGMWMTDPYQCYVHVFKALTGKTIASKQAADLLEKRFTEKGPKKEAVVLFVDELDRLWTRKQSVLFNIFHWPKNTNSKLIVLAVANTFDLPERMMMDRISSRIGFRRITFRPYTFKQLQEIIMSRIQELKVFDPDAVQLVARKVAAAAPGDARMALDICRFAAETAKVKNGSKKSQKVLIGMEEVDVALQHTFSNPVISAIRSSSKITKLFLQCLLSEFTRSGLEETTLLKVHQQVVSFCRFEGLHIPNSTEIFQICADLASSHFILIDNFRNDLYMKIRLNASYEDVTYALNLK